MEKVLCLRVTNRRETELTFYLEPWGEQFIMAPGATFHVVAKGPDGDSLEVEYGDNYVSLYGWIGSVVSVFKDGIELQSNGKRNQR